MRYQCVCIDDKIPSSVLSIDNCETIFKSGNKYTYEFFSGFDTSITIYDPLKGKSGGWNFTILEFNNHFQTLCKYRDSQIDKVL
jgi:hypothetical protein